MSIDPHLLKPPPNLIYDLSDYDNYLWDKALKGEKLNELVTTGAEKIYSFSTLGKEIFARTYNEELETLEAPTPEANWAKEFHDLVSQSPQFLDCKKTIELLSGKNFFKKFYLTNLFVEGMVEEIESLLPKQDFLNLDELRKDYIEAKQNNQSPEVLESIQKLGKENKKSQQEFSISSVLNQQKLNAILAEGSTNLKELNQNLNSFCWGEEKSPLSKTGIDWNTQATLAQNIIDNPQLAEIAKIAGRLKLSYFKNKPKQNIKNSVPSDVDLGNDLPNLLPQEWAFFNNTATKKIFFSKFSKKKLLNFTTSPKVLSLGPLIVCADVSGSTLGKVALWIKAVTLVLLNISRTQKRDFYLILFNADIVSEHSFLRQEKLEPAKIIPIFTSSVGGGTDWQLPLSRGLSIIQTSPAFKKADIIFITDDQCQVNPSWLKNFKTTCKDLGVATYGISIGKEGDNLLEILDEVRVLQNTETENLQDLFRRI